MNIFKACLATVSILTTAVTTSCAIPFFSSCSLDSEDYVRATEFRNDTNTKVEIKVSGKIFEESSLYEDGYGIIKVELFEDEAPITVANFLSLVETGFYDGLTFHRVVSGFVVQGGDPNADGSGGSDETIKGEFCANGVENTVSHTRGAISMARSDEYDSASSQFFIMHSASTGLFSDDAGLNGGYAAFGVIYDNSSYSVLDTIASKAVVNSAYKPTNKITIDYIKVID